ncbi:hypothetical protein POM88_002088 [Heracleum sosnowskyi]|uniref:Photosystem II cytochrome b559 alpha subunit lumenal region domain-containing protein n=1 Tax=Heracleum sosnowskyi TaxID=360622 RepID=A0AAD8NC97_9APIA|nr:hypothetical protein POM88_002088 [Heracleum sosnowskyi]
MRVLLWGPQTQTRALAIQGDEERFFRRTLFHSVRHLQKFSIDILHTIRFVVRRSTILYHFKQIIIPNFKPPKLGDFAGEKDGEGDDGGYSGGANGEIRLPGSTGLAYDVFGSPRPNEYFTENRQGIPLITGRFDPLEQLDEFSRSF